MKGADPAGWLARWARRKAAVRKAGAPVIAHSTAPAPADPATGPTPASLPAARTPASSAPITEPARPPPAEVRVEDLPPIDSLTYESDFSPYFRPGVPNALRQQALRKLWRTNPVLANLDGLNDYDEDYSTVGMIEEVVETLFQIGRGMADPEVAAKTASSEAAATPEPSPAPAATKGVAPPHEAPSAAEIAPLAKGKLSGRTA